MCIIVCLLLADNGLAVDCDRGLALLLSCGNLVIQVRTSEKCTLCCIVMYLNPSLMLQAQDCTTPSLNLHLALELSKSQAPLLLLLYSLSSPSLSLASTRTRSAN